MKNVFCSKEMTYPKLCDFFPADYSSLGCHVSDVDRAYSIPLESRRISGDSWSDML